MAVFAKWLTTSAAYGSGARAIAQRSGGCAQTIAFDKPVRRDAVLRVVSQLVQFLAEVDQLPEFIHRDGDPEALLACRKLNAGERASFETAPHSALSASNRTDGLLHVPPKERRV